MDLKGTSLLGWKVSKTTTTSIPNTEILKVFSRMEKKKEEKNLSSVTNGIQYSAEGCSQENKARKIIKEPED